MGSALCSSSLGSGESPRSETTTSTVEVSVVIPCLNEARTIACCIKKAQSALDRLGASGEVIVADNGSTDGSREISQALGARVVVVTGRGYGWALRGGISASLGKYVVMGDADDSYDFSEIGPFLERLRCGDDLVMGNRFRGGIMPGAMPWHHRYIGNPVLTGLLNLFFHSPIGDAHCGLRGFRKDAFERLALSSSGMEFASEMVVKACLHSLKISEIPIILHPDGRDRPPHLRSFSDGWRHLRLLLLLCPTWLFLLPAMVLMGGGLVLMAWLTPGGRQTGTVTFDVHTMTLAVLGMLLGYQLFWLWAHAKMNGWVSGILPPNGLMRVALRLFTLERGVAFGVSLFVAGFACDFRVLSEWYAQDLGALEVRTTLRFALWGLATMVLAAQTISGSFLLSMQLLSFEGKTDN